MTFLGCTQMVITSHRLLQLASFKFLMKAKGCSFPPICNVWYLVEICGHQVVESVTQCHFLGFFQWFIPPRASLTQYFFMRFALNYRYYLYLQYFYTKFPSKVSFCNCRGSRVSNFRDFSSFSAHNSYPHHISKRFLTNLVSLESLINFLSK